LLACLCADAAAYRLPLFHAGVSVRSPAVRMAEADKDEKARTSPLASFVGETTLSDFEKKKAEDNAKRLALRERINIGLPAVTLLAYAIASVVGEDKLKDKLKGGGDPFANAPGVAEAREKKKARQAKGKEEQAEFLKSVQKAVRGDAATE